MFGQLPPLAVDGHGISNGGVLEDVIKDPTIMPVVVYPHTHGFCCEWLGVVKMTEASTHAG